MSGREISWINEFSNHNTLRFGSSNGVVVIHMDLEITSDLALEYASAPESEALSEGELLFF